jgi:hypothetical protein
VNKTANFAGGLACQDRQVVGALAFSKICCSGFLESLIEGSYPQVCRQASDRYHVAPARVLQLCFRSKSRRRLTNRPSKSMPFDAQKVSGPFSACTKGCPSDKMRCRKRVLTPFFTFSIPPVLSPWIARSGPCCYRDAGNNGDASTLLHLRQTPCCHPPVIEEGLMSPAIGENSRPNGAGRRTIQLSSRGRGRESIRRTDVSGPGQLQPLASSRPFSDSPERIPLDPAPRLRKTTLDEALPPPTEKWSPLFARSPNSSLRVVDHCPALPTEMTNGRLHS